MTDDESDDARLAEILGQLPESASERDHMDDGRLVAYGNQELSDEERVAVEAHLVDCADCRFLVSELRRPIDPAAFERAREAARPQTRRSWGQSVVALVAIAAAFIGAFFAFDQSAVLPSYQAEGPFGGVVATRSDERGSAAFVPTSVVKFLVRPESASEISATLFVFVDGDGEQLKLVTPKGAASEPSGAFRFEREAKALLGSRFGLRTVHLVVAGGPVPSAPDGSVLEDLRRAFDGAQWFTFQIDYRARGDGKRE